MLRLSSSENDPHRWMAILSARYSGAFDEITTDDEMKVENYLGPPISTLDHKSNGVVLPPTCRENVWCLAQSVDFFPLFHVFPAISVLFQIQSTLPLSISYYLIVSAYSCQFFGLPFRIPWISFTRRQIYDQTTNA